MDPRLTGADRVDALADLDGWTEVAGRDAITKTYQFDDFGTAFGVMALVAMEAERVQHHPEWTNVYGRLEVTLTTHDAGGVTAKDVALARHLDAVASATR